MTRKPLTRPSELLEPRPPSPATTFVKTDDEDGQPVCPECDTPLVEVKQLNEQGHLVWGFAGHEAHRLYLMGMVREAGMTMRTARLRAMCCPKCRRGEFRY